jgi:hypothetical protein
MKPSFLLPGLSIIIALTCAQTDFVAQEKGVKSADQNKSANQMTAKPRNSALDGEAETIKAEQAGIGVEANQQTIPSHTLHPKAQWFPDAGLGLFIHWGISSVKGMNISWPMIPGRALANIQVRAQERERIVREHDYNLNGKPPQITPNQYWTMAADFKPTEYDPGKWLKAAKQAGFKYAVLTTRHHEGFALKFRAAIRQTGETNREKGIV